VGTAEPGALLLREVSLWSVMARLCSRRYMLSWYQTGECPCVRPPLPAGTAPDGVQRAGVAAVAEGVTDGALTDSVDAG